MTYKNTIIVLSIMILTIVSLEFLSHGEEIKPNKPFSTFPRKIGSWTGVERRFDQEIYDALGVDDSFLANYQTSDGRYIELYVGFYQSQKEGDLIHSPKNCMPGGGWNILTTSIEEIDIPQNDPKNVKTIKLLLAKGDQHQVVLYWFQSRGRFIASEYLQKIYLVIDSITRRRTDGSFVRLIAPVRDGSQEKALDDLKGFSRIIIPVLQEYIPS